MRRPGPPPNRGSQGRRLDLESAWEASLAYHPAPTCFVGGWLSRGKAIPEGGSRWDRIRELFNTVSKNRKTHKTDTNRSSRNGVSASRSRTSRILCFAGPRRVIQASASRPCVAPIRPCIRQCIVRMPVVNYIFVWRRLCWIKVNRLFSASGRKQHEQGDKHQSEDTRMHSGQRERRRNECPVRAAAAIIMYVCI